jgi:hypothetical protein
MRKFSGMQWTVFVLIFLAAVLFGIRILMKEPPLVPVVHEVLQKKVIPYGTYEAMKQGAVAQINVNREVEKSKKVRVDLRVLKGQKLGGLSATYLGLPPGEAAPSHTEVSFGERMAYLYHRKVEFKKCKKQKDGTEKCTVTSDTALVHAPELLERYLKAPKMKMDLQQFIAIADERVDRGRKFLDWRKLCKRYGLNAEECKLLQAILANLNGKDLVAYGMTELLPSTNGSLNAQYLDVLLQNAGAEFLYHIPALGDGLASLGIYQFTYYALRKDDKTVEGVSIVNSFVKEGGEKLPGSVVLLTGHQHHTAAFYFAVHNLAGLIARLGKQEVETLAAIHLKKQDEMVIIIATAHHNPKHTGKTVNKWLKAVYAAAHPKKDKKGKVQPVEADLATMFPRIADLPNYALKSHNNLVAVYEAVK